ncbi:MAG: 23S rRNA (adenine(1618)-N(6))-methyltransferase RlmF [Cytophagales bacterium]|nr:23S rRNA (adenine(1618)-N(6))-methyltransferase RlmF [Cytophaga sp.]
MPKQPKHSTSEKISLHPRNRHRAQYDFSALTESCKELKPFVSLNKYNTETIDFSDPLAVKTLNKALLIHFYGLIYWNMPDGYLCPPIPGRADYIHYMADLLSLSNDGVIPLSNKVQVLDIGIGANCVYPIIGHHEYGWQYTGSDIDSTAIESAEKIITENKSLTKNIECRLQNISTNIFKGIIQADELFDMTVCNPPFHSSAEDAEAGSKRKLNNLGIQVNGKPVLNFGGQKAELWCEGGEEAFVRRMIEESADIPQQCFWFSTLISKKEHLQSVYWMLKKVGAADIRTINMAQGQKISRIVAWTFLTNEQQKKWKTQRWR